MYAIIDIKGKQFKVEKGLELSIPKIDSKIGSKIEFDKPMFCLLYTSPSPRDKRQSRMPSSA